MPRSTQSRHAACDSFFSFDAVVSTVVLSAEESRNLAVVARQLVLVASTRVGGMGVTTLRADVGGPDVMLEYEKYVATRSPPCSIATSTAQEDHETCASPQASEPLVAGRTAKRRRIHEHLSVEV